MPIRIRQTLVQLARRAGVLARPPVDITDEYLHWLRFANAGMLEPGNLHAIDTALANLPPGEGALLEIGSWCGLSANAIAYLCRRRGVSRPLFTCDRWEYEGFDPDAPLVPGSAITHAAYRAFVMETFRRNAAFFSADRLPHTVPLASDGFFEAWQAGRRVTDVFGREVALGGGLAFCFIDGDHTYEQARRDFANADRHLVPGGWILFDDSALGSEWTGVQRVVAEALSAGGYTCVLRNPNALLRKASENR